MPNVNGGQAMRADYFDVVDGMNSTGSLQKDCVANEADPRLCFFPQVRGQSPPPLPHSSSSL